MAPRGTFVAPRVWKRPYTSIYTDNYRYGNSLYSGAIGDIERKYQSALARTRLGGDRPDLAFQTFADSHLSGGGARIASASEEARNRAVATSIMASGSVDAEISHVRSLSVNRPQNYSLSHVTEDQVNRRLMKSSSFDAYQSSRALASTSAEIEESKYRRSRSRNRRRPESAYGTVSAFEDAILSHSTAPEDHTAAFWMERCTTLQSEIDVLNGLIGETEEKIKKESTVVKNKLNQEVADIMMALDDQDRHNADLHKAIKKQAKQISDLAIELEASQRMYSDALDQLNQVQKRCSSMVSDVDEMRSGLQKVSANSS